MHVIDPALLETAIRQVAELADDWVHDLAPQLTCQEAEAVAALAHALYGTDPTTILTRHATSDDTGDHHA